MFGGEADRDVWCRNGRIGNPSYISCRAHSFKKSVAHGMIPKQTGSSLYAGFPERQRATFPKGVVVFSPAPDC
jgi:hypothetical protein